MIEDSVLSSSILAAGVTIAAAITAAVVALLTHAKTKKLDAKVDQIHEVVNSNFSKALAEIELLKGVIVKLTAQPPPVSPTQDIP